MNTITDLKGFQAHKTPLPIDESTDETLPTEDEIVDALVELFTIFITIDRRMKRHQKNP